MDGSRAVIYARVSTDDQDLTKQIHQLTRAVESRDFDLIEVFQEKESGGKKSRPELDRMMGFLRDKKADIVIVYRIDRLGRSLIHLLQIGEELRNLGINIWGVSDGIDTSTDMGFLYFQINSIFAQKERETIRKRTREALQVKKDRGEPLGRPKKIKQWHKTRLKNLWNNGLHNKSALSREIGISRTSVNRILIELSEEGEIELSSDQKPPPNSTPPFSVKNGEKSPTAQNPPFLDIEDEGGIH